MKGVRLHVSLPRYLLTRSVGRVWSAFRTGMFGGLKLEDVNPPTLPGPSWVSADVIACGICGTDLSAVKFSSGMAMEPFSSFPAVLGHEILGRVAEVGSDVTGLAPGQRVVIDPTISCTVRGFPATERCTSCAVGRHATCERAGEEGLTQVGGHALSRGLALGYHRDLPGGWGERVFAHASKVFAVPDALPDHTAVLTEPLAVALHAVLAARPAEDEAVLVIGSGAIALSTVWALRAVGFGGPITIQARRRHERELALKLGASAAIQPGSEARQALVETGASAYLPPVGPEVFSGGGFPLVFDCVGSASSLDQALRFTSAGGRVVVEGCASDARDTDLTFLWARELRITGSVAYGMEDWKGERVHTFQLVLRLLEEGGGPVEEMVTHAFPLSEYRDAIRTAERHARSGAVRVVLRPGS